MPLDGPLVGGQAGRPRRRHVALGSIRCTTAVWPRSGSSMFVPVGNGRCGEMASRGQCQFRDGHGGLHTLIWASAVGQRMLLHTWNGPDGGHDDALDYPFNAAVKALPWARGFPNVQLHD